jgi:hypothetical protein
MTTDYTRKPIWVNGHRCPSVRDAALYMEIVLRRTQELDPTAKDARVYYQRLAYAIRAACGEQTLYLGFTVATRPPRPRTALAMTNPFGGPLLRGHITHRLGAYNGEIL